MSSLGKTIARRPWLLPILALLFLVQAQQALACGLMMLSASTVDDTCVMHIDSGPGKPLPNTQTCCDDFITNGSTCHLDQELAAVSFQAGKLQLDLLPAPAVKLTDNFEYSTPFYPASEPDRAHARTVTPTYLATQRLRI